MYTKKAEKMNRKMSESRPMASTAILKVNNESVFYSLLKADLYRRGWAGGNSE